MKVLRFVFIALVTICSSQAQSQVGYIVVKPEHGFLPGKKFEYYPTIKSYDFKSYHLRIEITDLRQKLELPIIDCSLIPIGNESEFKDEKGLEAVAGYFQYLCPAAGIIPDDNAQDTLRVSIEALDARLIGFGSITAHGLCKISFQFHKTTKSYCTDLTDKSPHSPVSSNAFITRKTATRVILSGAIRETIEEFFNDLQSTMVYPST